MTTANRGLTEVPSNSLQPSVPINAALVALDAAVYGTGAIEFSADANRTLTAAECDTSVMVFTDSPTTLSAARDVIFPAHFPLMHVTNNTAQILTLKKSGQTGITLAAGADCSIGSCVTDVVRTSQGGGSAINPVGRHMVPIDAAAISPRSSGGCAVLTTDAGASNQPDLSYLAFDSSVSEAAVFKISMPPSWNEGTVTFVPRWKHPATTTNYGVCWKLRAVAFSNDDTLAASYGTAQSSVDTGGTTADLYIGPESSAITVAGSPQTNDTVHFELYRDPADGGDTLAVDAHLLGIDLYITTATATD